MTEKFAHRAYCHRLRPERANHLGEVPVCGAPNTVAFESTLRVPGEQPVVFVLHACDECADAMSAAASGMPDVSYVREPVVQIIGGGRHERNAHYGFTEAQAQEEKAKFWGA